MNKYKKQIEQAACDYASNRDNGAGFGYPSFTADLIEKCFVAGCRWHQQYMEEPHGEILTFAYDKPVYDFIVATASRYGEDIYNVMGNWQKIVLKEQTNY